jgi:hypothetical protein
VAAHMVLLRQMWNIYTVAIQVASLLRQRCGSLNQSSRAQRNRFLGTGQWEGHFTH